MKYLMLSGFLILGHILFAQNNSTKEFEHKQDTNYIASYTSKLDLTTRFYNSVKFSRYVLRDSRYEERLRYASNENLIIGVGVSYRRATFNLGLNFPFVNSWDEKDKGKTKYLDAQIHYYLDKYVFDAWLSTYRGYHLTNPHETTTQDLSDSSFPIRPEMRNTNFSFNLVRILNSGKFSFRAAFAQDEWQKKSAGSFLIGMEYNMMFSKGDSSFIPSNTKESDYFDNYQIKKSTIVNLAISGGYGHTFVMARHFYFSIVATMALGGSFTVLESDDATQNDVDGLTFNINYSTKVGLGYNSKTFQIGLATVQTFMTNHTPLDHSLITQNPGNVRINLIKRFVLNKPIRLPILNKILD
ncbi:MAG: DUF4421 family protein [Reichenbachiella sp.]|uniref:DUF4421 family protein n=1 Tax=Reichenbachiella sp. TaxID=2184521 RepID=UPI00296607E0|nr:DUF4421 family protein [Reichenbachiella sp.]MDW3211281.1 DUF4421 family protein [Reichenbachiella sp.]